MLQNIALTPVREDGGEEIEEEKFKPMQVTKKSVTYTDKDIKREFFLKNLSGARSKMAQALMIWCKS